MSLAQRDCNAPRVLTLEECVAFRNAVRGTVVLTNGCFDILHRGHLEYLRQSALLGDLLIIAVNSDESVRQLKGADRPLQDELTRAHVLGSLRCVDAVTIFPGPRLENEIRALRPDVYTKGADYSCDTLDPLEHAALEECGSRIHFVPMLTGCSTTSLIEQFVSRRLAPASPLSTHAPLFEAR